MATEISGQYPDLARSLLMLDPPKSKSLGKDIIVQASLQRRSAGIRSARF